MLVPPKKCHIKNQKYFFGGSINIIWLIHSYKGGDAVKEIEVIIDTDEIAEFFHKELIKRGYVPSEDEVDDLADITFDYLIEKCIIDEEVNDDY